MFTYERRYDFYLMGGTTLFFADHEDRIAYVYKDKKWQEVNYVFFIMDTIMGYDPYAPDGFKLYNSDIMELIEKILLPDAIKMFGEKPINKIKKICPEKIKELESYTDS
ncbi:MAG: hypothetical protein ACOX56_01640 [Acholeplasmataceae bacterium]